MSSTLATRDVRAGLASARAYAAQQQTKQQSIKFSHIVVPKSNTTIRDLGYHVVSATHNRRQKNTEPKPPPASHAASAVDVV